MKRNMIYLCIGVSILVVLIGALFWVQHHQSQIENATNIENNLNRQKQYVQKNPDSVEGNLKLGTSYYHKGNYEQAEKHLKKVITNDPDNLYGWIRLGNTNIEQEKFSKALECKKKAAQLDSDNPNSFVYLSQIELYFNVDQAAKDAVKASKMANKTNVDRVKYFTDYNQTIQTLKKDINKGRPLKGYYQLLNSTALYSKTYKMALKDQALQKYPDNSSQYRSKLKKFKPKGQGGV